MDDKNFKILRIYKSYHGQMFDKNRPRDFGNCLIAFKWKNEEKTHSDELTEKKSKQIGFQIINFLMTKKKTTNERRSPFKNFAFEAL